MVLLFITKIMIRPTTIPQISFALAVPVTKLITTQSGLSATKQRAMPTSKGFAPSPMHGGKRTLARGGIQNMLLRPLSCLSRSLLYVSNAIKQVLQEVARAVSSAPAPVVVVGIRDLGEREDVYNISIEDCHEYFANGILVSNSTVYWRVGMDKYGFGEAAILGAQQIAIEAQAGPEISPKGTFQQVTPTGEDPVQATLDKLKEQNDDWRNY